MGSNYNILGLKEVWGYCPQAGFFYTAGERERGLGGFLPKEKNIMAFLLYKVYISQLWRDYCWQRENNLVQVISYLMQMWVVELQWVFFLHWNQTHQEQEVKPATEGGHEPYK